jgi:hypothetical protein
MFPENLRRLVKEVLKILSFQQLLVMDERKSIVVKGGK